MARFIQILILFLLFSCSDKTAPEEKKLFETHTFSKTNLDFNNRLTETEDFNYFKYPYFYMGGGVSTGDFNNDGLTDIFFTGNQVKNKLYLNKGNLKFEDVSALAGIEGGESWYTGTTICDINTDGLLDIYVCVSGKDGDKSNELYVNNGDLTFTESAKVYGIADTGASIQSTFFDYDKDGDLDLYVANYPFTPFSSSIEYYREKIENPDLADSDRLYENLGNGKFTDVTEKAGILNFGLSLGVIAADFDNDGFQDIYISNDFASPDLFYRNNGNGTFSNILDKSVGHTAFYGMGIDAADFNNDGRLDMAQLDMNPEDNRRSKENMASMDPQRFDKMLNSGFHYQYMHNVLQLNQGLQKDSIPFFSNISRLAGVSSTDWSWASLLADFDNDGWKDLYITNGSRKDVNNKDFFIKLKNRLMFKSEKNHLQASFDLPSEKLDNYMFRNNGNFGFSKMNHDWGIQYEGFSNGAAYADLDNDGDLEIILNNIDSTAIVHKNNNTELGGNRFLRIKLKGAPKNPLGIGTKVLLEHQGKLQYQEMTLTRGFQSSVEPILHFGTKNVERLEKVTVTWPDGKQEELYDLATDQVLKLSHSNATLPKEKNVEAIAPLFTELTDSLGIDFVHEENGFDDYAKQLLLPHKYSNFGPALAVADVNGDGLDDFFVGGAAGYSGALYIQGNQGNFKKWNGSVWKHDKAREDLDALFFDADSDGDPDLYVVSGGYEFDEGSDLFQDRLYINNGKAGFSKAENTLPKMNVSGACVRGADYDNDGDVDLFIGGRVVPGKYPYPARSCILENRSTNNQVSFVDVTEHLCPELHNLGLVTDAEWTDFDKDGKKDLMVVGEWMPVTLFKNRGTTLKNVSSAYKTDALKGWWYSTASGDFDADGDTDYLVGNLGLNYKYRASEEEPFEVYAKDFDGSGTVDIVLGYYNDGTQYPVRGKQCSSQQMPRLEFKFQDYGSFASATLKDVYGEQQLASALHYEANTFASGYLENREGKTFQFHKLPSSAQFSSINDMLVQDFDGDGHLDALVVGNLFASEVETPRNDAGTGLMLKGDGKGGFEPIPYHESGFFVPNDAKKVHVLRAKKGKLIVVANNRGPLQVFSF